MPLTGPALTSEINVIEGACVTFHNDPSHSIGCEVSV